VSWTLAELARRVDGEVIGDPAREVDRVRPLEAAGARDLSFLSSAKYVAAARASGAGALVVGPAAPELAVDRIRVADPATAIARILELMHPPARPAAGVHPTAVVGEGAIVDPSAHVGPYVVLGRGVAIGAEAVLHAHVVVGDGAVVGARSVLHPHVVLYAGARLGADVEVHAGVVIGADGFGYASSAAGHRKIPQVGGVVIGDRVEIGANAAIDRGALADTTIGDGTKIDNLVQVGHNVQVGRNVLLCGQAGIAGSAELGDFVVLAGQSGVGDHVTVGAGTQIAAKSAVLQDEPGGRKVAGIPAVELGEWRRRQAIERRLGEIWQVVRRLARGSAGKGDEGGGPPEGER
jgi:UDP-3-O-[3-hydroxymyristoyl] glucosamine N-acyltransferase